MKPLVVKKIINYSSILWAISCYSFITIIAITTKLMTHDPNFSGGPETLWLIPMLTSIVISFISFGIMILVWLIQIFTIKEKINYKAPLGLSTAKSIISVVILTIITIIFFVGFRNSNKGYQKTNYNGQQLFDAINEYRTQHGKKTIPLELVMCDNLVARYLKIKSGDVGHEGFEEWAKKEEIDKKYIPMAELYIKETYTTKDAIKFWDGSPGHRLALLEDYEVGCSYANEGIGVVVFGKRISQ